VGRARARRRLNLARLGCGCVLLHLFAGAPAFAQTLDGASPPSASVCEQAGRLAEHTHALPAGLMLAIGRVESGRWDPARGRVVPWPWAVDAAGNGTWFDSKTAAIARAVALRDAGIRNVDVGCFQINLASHPFAFADLEQAFDPAANADYAGRFLGELYARFGSWDGAVAAYHSTQPALGIPYRQLVFANFPSGDHQPSGNVQIGPLVVVFASGARMRIWTPSGNGAAFGSVTMTSDASPPLPRVLIGIPSPR
jgi:hypothetical protein